MAIRETEILSGPGYPKKEDERGQRSLHTERLELIVRGETIEQKRWCIRSCKRPTELISNKKEKLSQLKRGGNSEKHKTIV